MLFSPSYLKKYAADGVGITSSALCLVHCMAMPALLSAGVFSNELPWLKYVFIVVAFCSITASIKETTSFKIAALLWASFWVFTFSLLFENKWHPLEYTGLLASAGIMAGHLLNIKSCSNCVNEGNNATAETMISNSTVKPHKEDESVY